MSLWAVGRWSSPPGGVGGRRSMNRCIMNTKHLKRRPARLASRSALFCRHRLHMGSGAAAPETTLHCSTSKSELLSSVGEQAGTARSERHLQGGPDGPARAAPWSHWLGLPPRALPVIARYFFVTFQKRILKSGAALQSEPGGPGDRPGNPPLPIAPDEGGRRCVFCLLSCLPFPAGGSDKRGCSACVLSYVWYFHHSGFIMQRGFANV